MPKIQKFPQYILNKKVISSIIMQITFSVHGKNLLKTGVFGWIFWISYRTHEYHYLRFCFCQAEPCLFKLGFIRVCIQVIINWTFTLLYLGWALWFILFLSILLHLNLSKLTICSKTNSFTFFIFKFIHLMYFYYFLMSFLLYQL